MSDETKVRTETQFDGTQYRARFAGHPDIALAGMGAIDATPAAWSPPHLLVAAAESCVFLTLAAAAEKMRIRITGYASTAEGILASADGRHKELREIVVRPRFEFADPADARRIPQLIKIAEEYCYVARSLTCPVRIEAEVLPA